MIAHLALVAIGSMVALGPALTLRATHIERGTNPYSQSTGEVFARGRRLGTFWPGDFLRHDDRGHLTLGKTNGDGNRVVGSARPGTHAQGDTHRTRDEPFLIEHRYCPEKVRWGQSVSARGLAHRDRVYSDSLVPRSHEIETSGKRYGKR